LPAALNAANEEAVHAFIDEQICLSDIPRVIEQVMNQHNLRAADTLEAVLEADSASRTAAQSAIKAIAPRPQVTSAA
jgi:1-deoxy-D-xylulose-5-phosphate reductoisomerase